VHLYRPARRRLLLLPKQLLKKPPQVKLLLAAPMPASIPAARPWSGGTTQLAPARRNLLPLIEEFNESNEYGITVEAQNQGSYNDIRDKVNASIAAGEQPAACSLATRTTSRSISSTTRWWT
jgi:ABC-type glycerol-3-phosphate transport system substrate-binding protein